MSASIHDILSFAFPDRGGWRVFGDQIEAGDGGLVPSMDEIEAQRAATEQALSAVETTARERYENLSNLRNQWRGLPDFIRGPFRDKFEAASRLLDEGDDEAAVALIEYCEPPVSFSEDQIETFSTIKTEIKSAIQSLQP
jgi:hypothetical protein